MNVAPRLSTGLPVYDGENYLGESLNALLGQSYDSFGQTFAVSANRVTSALRRITTSYSVSRV